MGSANKKSRSEVSKAQRKNRPAEPPAAPPAEPGETPQQKARRLRKHADRMKRTLPALVAAEAELRRHAAEWVAVIRNRITALANEVQAVMNAAKRDTVLGRVLSAARLSEVYCDLRHADCAATGLTIEGEDLPIPPLLRMCDYVCEKLFPLAAEGAKLMNEPAEGEPG